MNGLSQRKHRIVTLQLADALEKAVRRITDIEERNSQLKREIADFTGQSFWGRFRWLVRGD